jgi:hypothetical protein
MTTTESGISEGGYSLIVSFPDQSPSFCHGFEAGQLWERMCRFPIGLPPDGVADIETITRIENREVIRRMADNRGWQVETKKTDVEGWDATTLRKVAPPPTRPNPHGLRIVRDEGP